MDIITDAGGSPSFTVTLPTGSAGDLLLAWLFVDSTAARVDPDGWVFGVQDVASRPEKLRSWSRERESGDTDVEFTVGGTAEVVIVNITAAELDAGTGGEYTLGWTVDSSGPHIHSLSTPDPPALIQILGEWSFSGDVTVVAEPGGGASGFTEQAVIGPLTASESMQLFVRQPGVASDVLVDAVSVQRGGINAFPLWSPDRNPWTDGRVAWGPTRRTGWH